MNYQTVRRQAAILKMTSGIGAIFKYKPNTPFWIDAIWIYQTVRCETAIYKFKPNPPIWIHHHELGPYLTHNFEKPNSSVSNRYFESAITLN